MDDHGVPAGPRSRPRSSAQPSDAACRWWWTCSARRWRRSTTSPRGKIVRDIKPDNIFITRDSIDRRIVIVKLIDFGVSRNLETDEPTEQIAGDPLYMAPEQTAYRARFDHRVDLYALGMSFYESLTGRHPFQDRLDEPVESLLRMQIERDPEPPSSVLPPGPPRQVDAIDAFFAKACAKDPARRFQDARAMRHAMRRLLDP
ncbi:MAG: protein kinase [Deltaproteobacteria bacterium]|nr:protein kinase [Deltaproteobacteria bacterium]